MKRKLIKFRHNSIKAVLYLLWAVIALQAIVYFINPVRPQNYAKAVEYWTGIWEVFFPG